MTRVDGLAAWLSEQIDEDARRARACTPGPWRWGNWQTEFGAREAERTTLEHAPDTAPFPALIERHRDARLVLPSLEDSVEIGGYGDEPLEENAAHIVQWDPARVLAECDAKRRIIEECSKTRAVDGWEYDDAPNLAERTLRLLALPMAARPGYREEWRP